MTRNLSLALIPGDGIGLEVVPEAMKVLAAIAPHAGLTVDSVEYDLGSRRYNATGELLPESVVAELRRSDAILFGAIGDPSVPPGILERGIILELRFVMDYFVNLRPVRLYPGVRGPLADKGPAEIDFVVCREGTEGPYAARVGQPAGRDRARGGDRRCALHTRLRRRAASCGTPSRGPTRRQQQGDARREVECAGALRAACGMRTFEPWLADYPGVETDYCHVDAASMYMHHAAGALRRRRHGQPVRRHPHRHRGARSAEASDWRRAATSIRVGATRACSSRSTDLHPTSPAGALPIRPPRCSPLRCCSIMWARSELRRAIIRPRSRRTSLPGRAEQRNGADRRCAGRAGRGRPGLNRD